ncbi:hypothetical protein C8R44DRAFT_728147 [Mycena epipterygia]|nr:hypothetical protein C8R44DRAFT_728147 [Mycena epipterygia]
MTRTCKSAYPYLLATIMAFNLGDSDSLAYPPNRVPRIAMMTRTCKSAYPYLPVNDSKLVLLDVDDSNLVLGTTDLDSTRLRARIPRNRTGLCPTRCVPKEPGTGFTELELELELEPPAAATCYTR